MTVAVPPHLNNRGKAPEEEVDRLLRAFYQKEMPNPWPRLTPPANEKQVFAFQSSRRRFPMLRTRLALAAAMAFLVAGPLCLSTYFSAATNNSTEAAIPSPDDPKADVHQLPYELRLKGNQTSIEIKMPHGR